MKSSNEPNLNEQPAAPTPVASSDWLGGCLTLAKAEKMAKNCGYAWDAAGQKDNPINWGDASAFFLEGWIAGMRNAAKLCRENAKRGNPEGWTDEISRDCALLILDNLIEKYESAEQCG